MPQVKIILTLNFLSPTLARVRHYWEWSCCSEGTNQPRRAQKTHIYRPGNRLPSGKLWPCDYCVLWSTWLSCRHIRWESVLLRGITRDAVELNCTCWWENVRLDPSRHWKRTFCLGIPAESRGWDVPLSLIDFARSVRPTQRTKGCIQHSFHVRTTWMLQCTNPSHALKRKSRERFHLPPPPTEI